MTRKTLKLPEDDYERHNERRQEMGLTWAEYIDSQEPEIETGLSEAETREVVRDELQRFKDELMAELRR